MCRLLAKASVERETPSLELLQAPHSLSRQANQARLPEGYGAHDDGSGVAWLQPDGLHLEKRGASEAWGGSFQSVIQSMRTTALIAHNRKASAGLEVNAHLSHPYRLQYQGEEIAFCHNGGIQTFMTEAQERKTTDSLVFFEHLIAQIGSLTIADIKGFLIRSSGEWQFSSLNGLLLTRESIFAWRCYQDVPNATWNRERYCSLYISESPERVCIASEPIDSQQEWESIPNRTLLRVVPGGDSVQVERVSF
jgi:predicted glutamine amidotransferase